MNFLANYGLFLVKTITLVIAILAVLLPLILLGQREKHEKGKLEITHLNEKYKNIHHKLKHAILSKEALKKFLKSEKQKEEKGSKKKTKAAEDKKKKLFVLKFEGDIKASDTFPLTEAINAVLGTATQKDEIVVRLDSQGGLVHAYGLAASQLQRIRDAGIPLTVAIDKVAASGGYLMACVADKILAAPFAILGSIGVLAQLPNFHRLMKKNDIDYEQITAGQFKRTLTMFGKNTEEARRKFQEEIDEVHTLFKDFIRKNRPQVDIEKVATGEHWLAEKAIELKLVDQLITAEAYLLSQLDHADIYEIHYTMKKSLSEKVGLFAQAVMDRFLVGVKQQESEKNLV